MASNLSTIGFVFADDQEFQSAVTELGAEAATQARSAAGDYAVWRSRSGAEVWLHVGAAEAGDAREIVGLTPFFEGKSEVALGITAIVRRPDDNAFEGAFHAWVAPDEETGTGSYPMVFDAVDFALHCGQERPFACTARISGFAREMKAHASEQAYYDGRDPDGAPVAAQAFFPLGLFAAGGGGDGDEAPPSSTALVNGRVREHRRLTNERTGRSFHWMLVESLDATFDILADPEVVEGEITVGGIVEVACWIVGRILTIQEPPGAAQATRH